MEPAVQTVVLNESWKVAESIYEDVKSLPFDKAIAVVENTLQRELSYCTCSQKCELLSEIELKLLAREQVDPSDRAECLRQIQTAYD